MENLKIKIEYGKEGFKIELDGNNDSVREEFKKIKDEGLGRILGNVDYKFDDANVIEVKDNQLIIQSANKSLAFNDAYPAIMDVVMKNKPKSETEWITVYTFYASNFGETSINRNDILNYYEKTKRNSKSNISNFAANFKSTIGKDYLKFLNDNELILTPKGVEKAKEIIKRDPSLGHTAPAASTNNKKASAKTDENKTKKTSSSIVSYQLVSGLNLNPEGNISLKDFYNQYDAKSYMEKNLLFCYYLVKYINVPAITQNHIYTCYKKVNERMPGNLYQSLADTKMHKGWIDTKNVEDIKLTIAGENYLEHDLLKKTKTP